jgi:hypothetical protein
MNGGKFLDQHSDNTCPSRSSKWPLSSKHNTTQHKFCYAFLVPMSCMSSPSNLHDINALLIPGICVNHKGSRYETSLSSIPQSLYELSSSWMQVNNAVKTWLVKMVCGNHFQHGIGMNSQQMFAHLTTAILFQCQTLPGSEQKTPWPCQELNPGHPDCSQSLYWLSNPGSL